jgi:hypothetical protein
MIELRDVLPSGFDPSSIDSRLLRGDTNITLLGIAAVDPDNEFVATADKVISGVREFLSNNPDADDIDADDIAHLIGVPGGAVEATLERLSYLGVFHNFGMGHSGGWTTIRISEQAFAGYFAYESIGQVLNSILNDDQSHDRELGNTLDELLGHERRASVLEAPSQPNPVFGLGKPVQFEESRHAEFKEVTGKNPVESIKNTADEYAVAFLNREGGKIYWGVRDGDRTVVGVSLNHSQRDALRRVVTEKLAQVTPPIPVSDFRFELHPVRDAAGQVITDLYVCELDVPRGRADELYATGGNEVFVKTDGGKRKLNVQQIVAEDRRRRTIGEGLSQARKQSANAPNRNVESYPPIPLDARSLSSYIGGSPVVKQFDKRIAEAADVRVERLGYADAFLERLLWQAHYVGVNTLAELDEAVRSYGDMAVRLSHYFTPQGSLLAGRCIDLVFDVMVAQRGTIENTVTYFEGMPHTSASRMWAEEVWHACQQIKMYDT